MNGHLCVTNIHFTAAAERDIARGLDGYIALSLGGIVRLDGITLRHSRAGRRYLSFPQRRDARGQAHDLIQPLTNDIRREIEVQVLAAVGPSIPTLQRKDRHA